MKKHVDVLPFCLLTFFAEGSGDVFETQQGIQRGIQRGKEFHPVGFQRQLETEKPLHTSLSWWEAV